MLTRCERVYIMKTEERKCKKEKKEWRHLCTNLHLMLFLVYSKSEYTTRIGQCVRPSVRLHDNFWTQSAILMKFSAQYSLMNISVERRRWAWLDEAFLSYCKNTHFSLCFSVGRSTCARFRKKLFYQSQIKSHLLYTIR